MDSPCSVCEWWFQERPASTVKDFVDTECFSATLSSPLLSTFGRRLPAIQRGSLSLASSTRTCSTRFPLSVLAPSSSWSQSVSSKPRPGLSTPAARSCLRSKSFFSPFLKYFSRTCRSPSACHDTLSTCPDSSVLLLPSIAAAFSARNLLPYSVNPMTGGDDSQVQQQVPPSLTFTGNVIFGRPLSSDPVGFPVISSDRMTSAATTRTVDLSPTNGTIPGSGIPSDSTNSGGATPQRIAPPPSVDSSNRSQVEDCWQCRVLGTGAFSAAAIATLRQALRHNKKSADRRIFAAVSAGFAFLAFYRAAIPVKPLAQQLH